MTHKEFADKIFNKFMELHPYDTNNNNKGLGESIEISKECSIILINEILNALKDVSTPYFLKTFYENAIFEIEEK